MNIKKSIQLTSAALETILETGQSVDFRLDEQTWADLEPGDVIEFWEDFSGYDKTPSPHSRKVIVEIKEIFKAATFSQLIDGLPATFSERGEKKQIIADLRQWWTQEKEKEIGVLGFRVEMLPQPP